MKKVKIKPKNQNFQIMGLIVKRRATKMPKIE